MLFFFLFHWETVKKCFQAGWMVFSRSQRESLRNSRNVFQPRRARVSSIKNRILWIWALELNERVPLVDGVFTEYRCLLLTMLWNKRHVFLIELQVLCLVKNTHTEAGLEDAGGMLQRGYEFRSQPARTRERKQGRLACALAMLDSVWPPCFLLEVTTGRQLVFSAPPIMEQQWVTPPQVGRTRDSFLLPEKLLP